MTHVSLFNPGPVLTHKDVRSAAVEFDVCHRSASFGSTLTRVQNQLTALCNLDSPKAVLIPGSASYALEATIASVSAKWEKEPRILALSNGTYGDRMHEIAKAYTHTLEYYSPGFAKPFVEQEISELISRTSPDVICVVHHETSSGILNCVKSISAIARQNGAELIVDAVSSIGAEVLDIEQSNSYIVGTANKCIEGLPGLSFVLAAARDLAKLHTNNTPVTLNIARHFRAQESGDVLYTAPTNIIAALDAALRLLKVETVARRNIRYSAMLTSISEYFDQMGLTRLLPPSQSACSLASFALPAGTTYSIFSNWCDSHDIQIYHGQGPVADTHFRIATMGQLEEADRLRLISCVDKFLHNRVETTLTCESQ